MINKLKKAKTSFKARVSSVKIRDMDPERLGDTHFLLKEVLKQSD